MLLRNKNGVWEVIAKNHFIRVMANQMSEKSKLWLLHRLEEKSRSPGRVSCATGTRDSEFGIKDVVVSAITFFLNGWPRCPALIAIRTLQLVINVVEFAKSIIISSGAMISFPTSMFAFKALSKCISR